MRRLSTKKTKPSSVRSEDSVPSAVKSSGLNSFLSLKTGQAFVPSPQFRGSLNDPRDSVMQKKAVIVLIKKIAREKRVPVALFVTLVITTSMAVHFYLKFIELKKNPQQFAQGEVQKVIAKVSRLIVLPEGETPTMATVTDLEKLKNQPFFSKAQIGDKVFIYASAKKAILYDPVNNKIVEVAPLNIGDTQQKVQP